MSDDVRVKKDTTARVFDISLDINASPDAVWSALTDAKELVRWFPLEARVTPGEGGTMYWGWGGDWGGESRIVGWEPNRRLKIVETRQGFDADGKPIDRPGENRELAVEVTLETVQGKTRVRLVHSGFGEGADWDDELDGISTGWQFELRGLRHYLERHRGRDRHHGWARASSPLSEPDVWRRITGSQGFDFGGRVPEAGRPYQMRFRSYRFTGTTLVTLPDADVGGTVSELEDALFRLGTFRAAGRTGVMAWLASYRPEDGPHVKEFEREAQAFLDGILGDPAA